MEMGCGKSKVLIDNIYWLWQQKEIDTAIIVAPKGVYMNWKNSEIPIHLPDDIDAEFICWKAVKLKRKENFEEDVQKGTSLEFISQCRSFCYKENQTIP